MLDFKVNSIYVLFKLVTIMNFFFHVEIKMRLIHEGFPVCRFAGRHSRTPELVFYKFN